jgi:hypothetical protein
MKNLLALVGLLVVGFGGVGWYMGWYTLKVDRSSAGELQVQTKVNTKQVAEDTGNWLQQAGKFLDTKVQKASEDAKVQTPCPVGTTPGPVTPPSGTAVPPSNQGNWLLPPQTYPINQPK